MHPFPLMWGGRYQTVVLPTLFEVIVPLFFY